MNKKIIKPVIQVNGTISLPGSKSITNRILLMAALSNGKTTINNYLESDDTSYMLGALKELGVEFRDTGNSLIINGINHKFPVLRSKLFLGNAGTAFRPLTAVLAMMGGDYEISGIDRMHERPIKDLVNGLEQIGAKINYLGASGLPPLKILPSNITYKSPIKINGSVSSQFLTALLMACPLANQDLIIKVNGDLISKPYINITLKLLERFGVQYKNLNWQTFQLSHGSRYKSSGEISVEGDASSASYFFAAAAILGKIEVNGINATSIQGDLNFLKVIDRMGAKIEYLKNSVKVTRQYDLKGLDIDCKDIPDAAMTLAVMAIFAKGKTILRNIGSWRVKETDRIYAMQTELKKLGAHVASTDDSISISPPNIINNNIEIDTYNDHRIAMCFSLVALANKTIVINDPECVNKTYPNFFKDFDAVTS
ncbi:MAG: 3-phosphoshikimate 1-carboxyvinyltransferase [Methylophilaceae bacterium]|nr:3-phosphoshikimate 1-carboxyvinyltransferase [Methylophilaceae bacterium]